MKKPLSKNYLNKLTVGAVADGNKFVGIITGRGAEIVMLKCTGDTNRTLSKRFETASEAITHARKSLEFVKGE